MPRDSPARHPHANCAKSTLALAEAACAESGARLTRIRRRVLEVVAEAKTPIGAYDIIDELAKDGTRPAPITVYRALDFLMDHAFVHRIASKNAYLACNHSHGSGAMVVFLICETCGSANEISDGRIAVALATAAKASGFSVRAPVLELSGVCAECGKT
jgi:Fur family zinc uptake transcriptional regulator